MSNIAVESARKTLWACARFGYPEVKKIRKCGILRNEKVRICGCQVYFDFQLPTYIWSEEYQTDMMSRHFEAFDQLREKGWFVGEMIWNFADFKTAQTYLRVGGNKKGLFTRQRQPKASAHLMRRRYWSLAHELDKTEVPSDLDTCVQLQSSVYVSSSDGGSTTFRQASANSTKIGSCMAFAITRSTSSESFM
ncbi:hypothetical protein NQ318_022409 [Aromia moschata]|uniref:Glycoside hydrolase family 2 catalytic domain-containing protein n=1 Tax=Aromia moschata TaxID=1265417 RepID=A0AAV8Z5L4_9CUCU|nr:hypothetical protein NQ318_022409 [Aromia moschata]